MLELPLSAVCTLHRPQDTVAQVRAAGDLDGAIAAAANDPGLGGLDDLLRLRRALEEGDDPKRRAQRLRAAAARLERRASRLLSESADHHGRGVYRQAQGDDEMAIDLIRRGVAAEGLASELSEEALSLSLRAAEIERRLEQAGALAAVASA